jgi:lipopolysaccharide export system permease protein
MRELDIPAITMASSGRMVSNIEEMNVSVLLRNGSLHRPKDSDAQIVEFEQYLINIPLHLPNRVRAKERNILNMEELLKTSRKYGRDTERGRILLVEFHKRLVLPAGCLILSILALPLGLLAGPGKKTVGVPIGLGVFVIYYVLYATAKSLSEDGVGNPSLLMWLPNSLFLILSIYCLMRVAHDLPILPYRIQALFFKIYTLTLKPLVSWIVTFFILLRNLFHTKIEQDSETIPPDFTSLPIRADGQKKLFHLESCKYYTDEHCTITFESVNMAQECGFSACSQCQAHIDIEHAQLQETDLHQ